MSRYQFIWWGWSDMFWQLHHTYPGGSLDEIYDWWICLGPLEIRRLKR